jgi:diguanylate cyclase (GGDEF)-like protein
MRPSPRHIGARATILAFVVGWSFVIGALVVFLAQSQARSRRDVSQRLEARTAMGSEFASLYVRDLFARERAQATSWLAGDRVATETFRRVAADAGVSAAVLLDRRGRLLQVVPSKPALLSQALARDHARLVAAAAGRAVVSSIVLSAARQAPMAVFAVPFETPSGRRVFSAAYDVSRTPLGGYMSHMIVVPGRRLYLVDAAGSLIAGSELGQPGAVRMAQVDPRLANAVRGRVKGSYDAPGGRRYFVSTPIAGTPWRIIVSVPEGQLYSSVDGASRWLAWVAVTSLALAGLVILLLISWLMRGRARLAALNGELDRLARVDALTGLTNRRGIEEMLSGALSAARRHQLSVAVLMIDIDHFKRVNDTLGHSNGDAVLCHVAHTLQSAVRTEDTIGRWGGEEFLAILPATDEQGAVFVAERLRAGVAATRAELSSGEAASVTITIGAAVWTSGAAEDLVHRADAALYAGKAAGRDNVQLFVVPAIPGAAAPA